MVNGRIAVPSNDTGGLDGKRSGHFGHCDSFTLVDVNDGEIKGVSTLKNEGHTQGGCMVPVTVLANNNVNYLIVSGIGKRPLMGFKQVGIQVFHEEQTAEIGPVVEALIAGQLPEIKDDQVCGGSGNCSH